MNQLKNKITGQTRKAVEKVSTKSIKSTGNRKNNPENQGEYYEWLKASIKENGVLTPIIVDVETQKIISGNLRYQIALEVGCKYIPVVYEELEIANKIIDFYNQPNQQLPICENYINQFVTDIQRIIPDNRTDFKEIFQSNAALITVLCLTGDDVFYAFNDLLFNIHAGSIAEFLRTRIFPSTLNENYIFKFITVVQSDFRNLNQEEILTFRRFAITIFEIYYNSGGAAFEVFDKLLNNIYWGRIID